MGASRENYPDEKIGMQIHASMPNLNTLLWANHSYQNEGMFKEEILEHIHSMRSLLNQLEEEIQKGGK